MLCEENFQINLGPKELIKYKTAILCLSQVLLISQWLLVAVLLQHSGEIYRYMYVCNGQLPDHLPCTMCTHIRG